MDAAALWIPLGVLFATALITAFLRRHSKDHCLKIFQGSFVFVRLKTGEWVWGDLRVFSNALELRFRQGEPLGNRYLKESYVFYEHNLDTIDRIVRPSPGEGTPERERWRREIQCLQSPNLGRRFSRQIRNFINMVRDAFAQSLVMIFGAVKKKGPLSKVQIGDDKVTDVSKTLVGVVLNAYEPILEHYLGRQVVVETPLPNNQIHEQVGVLQEYSAKYILVRDVELLLEVPPWDAKAEDHDFDVIFVRPAAVVRHLARPLSPNGRDKAPHSP